MEQPTNQRNTLNRTTGSGDNSNFACERLSAKGWFAARVVLVSCGAKSAPTCDLQ